MEKRKKRVLNKKCLNPLNFLVGRAGIEPAANGLKVRCSTAELTAHVDTFLNHRLLTGGGADVKEKLENFQF